MKKQPAGFTLIELGIVVAILMVLATMVVPNIQRILASYKLDAAGHSVASVVQQARLQAVKTNQPAYAQFTLVSPSLVFVGDTPAAAYVTGNPDVVVSSSIAFTNAGAPDDGELREYLGVTGVANDPEIQVGGIIGFNSRGLPCVMNTSAADCPQQDPATNQVYAFEWLMSDGRGGWEAVTVTAAGRVKSWRMSGLDSTKKNCGYAACWQ